jgi:hypothetical protein
VNNPLRAIELIQELLILVERHGDQFVFFYDTNRDLDLEPLGTSELWNDDETLLHGFSIDLNLPEEGEAETPERSADIVDANLKRMGASGLMSPTTLMPLEDSNE